MGFIAPKERKHLSADALFGFVRSLCANVPDHRSDDTDLTLTDALMAGFAMFSLKCPSLLDFDKQRAEGNLKTIYGNTAKVALSAQVIGILRCGNWLPSAYFA
jgi:hypothetical protein